MAFAVVFVPWLLGRLGRPGSASSASSTLGCPPSPASRIHFSWRSLGLFIAGLAGSIAVLAQGGAYQPFGVVVLGIVLVIALLGLGQYGR
jgi:hypothetical protein